MAKSNDTLKTIGAAVAGAAVGAVLANPKARKMIADGFEEVKAEVKGGQAKLLKKIETAKGSPKDKTS